MTQTVNINFTTIEEIVPKAQKLNRLSILDRTNITNREQLIGFFYCYAFNSYCWRILKFLATSGILVSVKAKRLVVQITPLEGNTGHPSLSNHLKYTLL